MSPGQKPHILIAGAGLGGLSAAIALIQRGCEVDVYEQASELKEVGAGVQISPNGNRALASLGVLETLRPLSCDAEGKEIRLWNTGETWKLFDLGTEAIERYGFPYFTVYRPDLLQVLADEVRRLKPDAVHLGHRCIGSSESNGRVTLRFASGGEVTGDALIGADGVHSMIRRGLFGEDNPTFSGLIAWRGVIPMKLLPKHMTRLVGTNWVGPGGHIVNYPLHRGELMNFVAVVERADWQIESWSTQGTADEAAADFPGWNDDIQQMIRKAPTLYKWALMVREPMERWSVGHATLLGDACHPTLPFLAQGAVMAIEDGVVLARCFEKYEGDIATALAAYETARVERTRRMVLGSKANVERFHNRALAEATGAKQYVDREWSRDAVTQRYEWLFTYDVDNVEI
jgi:salicylate hydroxylase